MRSRARKMNGYTESRDHTSSTAYHAVNLERVTNRELWPRALNRHAFGDC
jgi:hypothetical protein